MTRFAIHLLLLSLLSSISACASIAKPEPADDPAVDELAADSLRAPTMRGALDAGGAASDDFDANALYHGWTLSLRGGQSIDLRAGGVAQDGSILDTVLYVYGPKDAAGRRGAYLARNDDRTSGDPGSRTIFVAPRTGEYLVVVTTYTKPDPGHYAMQAA